MQSCSLESTRCALGKTCGMHALIDCRSPAALELIKLLSRHSATGPMLEQFMLPLGLDELYPLRYVMFQCSFMSANKFEFEFEFESRKRRTND